MSEEYIPTNKPQPVVVRNRTNPIKAILYAILALMFIVIAAFAGWWYGQEQAKTDSSTKISTLEQKVIELEKKVVDATKTTTLKSPSTSQQYLEIKEWGVKIKSTDSPMVYKLKSQNGEQALLTNEKTQDIVKKQINPPCAPDHEYLANIIRSKTPLQPIVGNTVFVKKIGEYNYYASHGNGSCSSDSTLEEKYMMELFETIKTIELK